MRPSDDQKCSNTDPRVKCVGRWEAGLRGEFLFDFHAKGWVWRVFKDDFTMRFLRCPWCKEPLPDVGAVYDRLRKGIDEDED